MQTIYNEATGRAKVILTEEERKAKQNAQYAKWRTKLEAGPQQKLDSFRARKNAASKKCIAKRKDEIAKLRAELEALKSE